MTTAQLQQPDERLARIASTLAQARSSLTGDPQGSYLVDLSDEDAELFDASLKSGEFLAFLDRNPQFDVHEAADGEPDYTWDEFAAAGQSIDGFVGSFRPASLTMPVDPVVQAQTSATVDSKQTAILAALDAFDQAQQRLPKVGNVVFPTLHHGSMGAPNETPPLSTFTRTGWPLPKGFYAQASPTTAAFSQQTTANTFAILMGPHAVAVLDQARRKSTAQWNALTVPLTVPVDVGSSPWPFMCMTIVNILAQHAGLSSDQLRAAGAQWLREVQTGQALSYGVTTMYEAGSADQFLAGGVAEVKKSQS